jgi:YD repeat-containing protein
MNVVSLLLALGLPSGQAVPNPAPLDVADGLRLAFGLPRIVAANVYMSRSMVVEAVYQATALSGGALMGRVVNTGTLAPGYGGAFQYSPEPTDRLVVHYAGQVHEFVVHEAQGNTQAMTADQWLLAPHHLSYTHRLDGQAEAEIVARYDGGAFEVSARGWTTQWGARYDLDLNASGRSAGVRDYGGQDIQTVYDLTGRIVGQELEIAVQERHSSSLVAATSPRLLPSQRGTASQSLSTLSSTLSMGGITYQLEDVRVESGQQARAGQGDAGMTGVSGAVLRDGSPFGRFVFQAGRAFLETSDGLIAMDAGPGGD